jgi:hypothetical protein
MPDSERVTSPAPCQSALARLRPDRLAGGTVDSGLRRNDEENPRRLV